MMPFDESQKDLSKGDEQLRLLEIANNDATKVLDFMRNKKEIPMVPDNDKEDMTHREVYSIFLKTAERQGSKVITPWVPWRNQWCEENGYRRCEECRKYHDVGSVTLVSGTTDKFIGVSCLLQEQVVA